MKIKEIVKLLDAKILCGENCLENEVMSAFACDMMSDVLAFVSDQGVLITGLINPQVIRTASMMDMLCIVFVRGKQPTEEMLELARECGIAVVSTEKRAYDSCGILYSQGLYRN